MTPDGYAKVSRRHLALARGHLVKGNLRKARERVRGASDNALKAVAEQRGWLYDKPFNLRCVGGQLGREFGKVEDFYRYLSSSDYMLDYFGVGRSESSIKFALANIEKFVEELDVIRNSPPLPYTVADSDDINRLGHLLGLKGGERPAIGDYSAVGFSVAHGDGGWVKFLLTALPEAGDTTVADPLRVSRGLLGEARLHLAEGDGSQAAEKIWGAAAQALAAIGERRGWVHDSDNSILCIGEHLGREFGREREFGRYLCQAHNMHGDYYGNGWRDDVIESALADIEEFVGELEVIRDLPPRPYTVRNDSDRIRLGCLLGLARAERPAIGDYSPVGYSLAHGDG